MRKITRVNEDKFTSLSYDDLARTWVKSGGRSHYGGKLNGTHRMSCTEHGIYSYSQKIIQPLEARDGTTCYLCDISYFSNITATHQRAVKMATNGYSEKVITTDYDLNNNKGTDLVSEYYTQLEYIFEQFPRKRNERTRQLLRDELSDLIKNKTKAEELLGIDFQAEEHGNIEMKILLIQKGR